MKEKKVNSYSRRTKSGKTVMVKGYSAKYKGGSTPTNKKGSGNELLGKLQPEKLYGNFSARKYMSPEDYKALKESGTRSEYRGWMKGTKGRASKKFDEALKKHGADKYMKYSAVREVGKRRREENKKKYIFD